MTFSLFLFFLFAIRELQGQPPLALQPHSVLRLGQTEMSSNSICRQVTPNVFEGDSERRCYANLRLNEFRALNSLNTPFFGGGQFVGAAFPTWASLSVTDSSPQQIHPRFLSLLHPRRLGCWGQSLQAPFLAGSPLHVNYRDHKAEREVGDDLPHTPCSVRSCPHRALASAIWPLLPGQR